MSRDLLHTHTHTHSSKEMKLPCLISSVVPSVISSAPAVISPVQKKSLVKIFGEFTGKQTKFNRSTKNFLANE